MANSSSEDRAVETLYAERARANLRRVGLSSESIQRFLGEVIDGDVHVKTILSLSNAAVGVLQASSLCIHVIGKRFQIEETFRHTKNGLLGMGLSSPHIRRLQERAVWKVDRDHQLGARLDVDVVDRKRQCRRSI